MYIPKPRVSLDPNRPKFIARPPTLYDYDAITPSIIFLFEKLSRYDLEVVNLYDVAAKFLPLWRCWNCTIVKPVVFETGFWCGY